ncbi:pentapeptide repeat-containing protein [Rhodoblastus sp.]|uniref:pentapeptide repeat-containing protein n=1 Tax=Rhodoblastus sp. TaxID=1962975 RepID=UPI003F9E76F8
MKLFRGSRRAICLAAFALIGAAPFLPARVSAQGMMSGVDLDSPAFTKAELSRGDIERLIAKLKPGQKLDLAGANLRDARLNHADLAGANFSRAAAANVTGGRRARRYDRS